MHVLFTETEKEYIDMKTFGWKIKPDCPDEIRKRIEHKLKLLKKQN